MQMAKVPNIVSQMVVNNGDESHAKRKNTPKEKNTSLEHTQSTQKYQYEMISFINEGLGYVAGASY